ncbi:5-formyltetrahydrofolate cyclo-ligase-like [Choristoneura fumiferana]|uniref:5-formyltetrahydrofolate cyclo-ligase-like n=1 Tax=Choristoneura fumiferana TaxID=7141 RepID=UPI003D15BF94
MAPGTPNPAKMLLRNEVASRIASLSAEEKTRQSRVVYEKVINHPWYKSSKRIALYMSTDQEVDTARLLEHVKQKGAAFVPQYAGGHMKMLRVETGDEAAMDVTKHGIAQHAKDAARDDALESGGLDLIIAPGLAFSKSGSRLGHGGGYYDRFLAKVRSNPETAPKVVALAFNCQMVEKVPVEDTDQKMDDVIAAD